MISIVLIGLTIGISNITQPTPIDIPVEVEKLPIDILYASSSHVGLFEPRTNYILTQNVTYEITPIEGNNYTTFGTINDTLILDGKGFGIEVNWTNPPYSIMRFGIFFKVLSEYTEKFFDLVPRIVINMTHDVAFDWILSASVSQVEFISSPVIWSFEINGTSKGSSLLDVNTTVIEDSMYNAILDGYFEPCLILYLPLEQGYHTRIMVDYMDVTIWDRN